MDKTISSACNITTGKLDANKAVTGGDYPFFTCAAYPDQIDHYAFDDDVVLVAGNNASGNFHVSRFNGKFNAYQRTYILTAKSGYNINYIYYALKLELKRLREKSQGSQTKFLTMPILNGIHFRDITYEEQSEIANVLNAIDKKIELNNCINAELEAMAKVLYDYWFVQFDFPDANGKPYKSAGGKMVYNSILKREIPEGWSAVPLKKLLETPGKSVTASDLPKDAPYTPLDSLPMKKMSFGYVQSSNEAKTSLIEYQSNDILIGAMRVYFHRVCIAPYDGITRSTVINLRPINPLHLPYLYQVCNEKRMISYATKISVGTQQPYVNWENALENFYISYPGDSGQVKDYSDRMLRIVQSVINREIESSKLAQLRDWLLPMLMNGQVTVSVPVEEPSREAKYG